MLWFEHDLYDQLQLLQILDWLSRQDSTGVRLSLIQVGSHPDVVPFYGLGQLTGAQLAALLPARLSRSERQLLMAAAAGAATRRDLYVATQRMEPWPWNDMSVFLRLDGLASGSRPALDRRGDSYGLTDYGRRLLAGDEQAVRSRAIDTWLGGVHITQSPAR